VTAPHLEHASSALADAFAEADVEATFHAVDLSRGAELGHRPDQASVMATVFKLPVPVALARVADAGTVDLGTQITVPVEGRAFGPTGLSTMSDPGDDVAARPGPLHDRRQ
jgi:beta-lactamase class A